VTRPKFAVWTAVGPRACQLLLDTMPPALWLRAAAPAEALESTAPGRTATLDRADSRWPGVQPRWARKRRASVTRGGASESCRMGCAAGLAGASATGLCAQAAGPEGRYSRSHTASAMAPHASRTGCSPACPVCFPAPPLRAELLHFRSNIGFVTRIRSRIPASPFLKIFQWGSAQNPPDNAQRNTQIPGMKLGPIIGQYGRSQ